MAAGKISGAGKNRTGGRRVAGGHVGRCQDGAGRRHRITTKGDNPMVFGRGRKAKQEQLSEPDEATDAAIEGAGTSAEADTKTPGRAATGPFDVAEIESQDGYVDLGALLIAPREGLQLRLEVEEASQRVVAVTMDLEGSSLQLQAFAAPRSEGLWDEIREQIGQSV